ncbi:MAG: hypothetical protein PHN19_02040 [Patescibacteria group bacterium]|nr:hypothetical protein [Patescibacteria group bacterium]
MTKKRLLELLIATFAFLIFLPTASFAQGSGSGTMIVTATPVKPTTLHLSKATVKRIVSDKTVSISYNAISDLSPVIEVKKEIIKGQFVEIVTVTF